jgi:branched-chain amino acid transport system substrate-binding protein
MRPIIVLYSVLAVASLAAPAANAQISDDVVRIGVLNDQSGVYADLGGQGSVVAARIAIEDAGGTVLGKPVEIIFADHQNKADIGSPLRGAGSKTRLWTWRSDLTTPRWRSRSSNLPPTTTGS